MSQARSKGGLSAAALSTLDKENASKKSQAGGDAMSRRTQSAYSGAARSRPAVSNKACKYQLKDKS